MYETSRIELSRAALRKNLRFLRRQLRPGVCFSSVIKGNAYGHGIALYLPMAERCGVRHFSVFSADEAVAAHRARTAASEIMIMGQVEDEALEWVVEHGISFYVFDERRLLRAQRVARRVGAAARIHLELETGLHRTGLEGAALRRVVKRLVAHPQHLALQGVCTHYAGAESVSNYLRIQQQIAAFERLCGEVDAAGLPVGPAGAPRHTACSAAALIYPETTMEMVRVGIAQYGFWPSRETQIQFFASRGIRRKAKSSPLERIIKWMSRVMSVKKIRRGDYVGYGAFSLATRDATIAGVPVGYFHGFSRDLSNRGHVLLHGLRAPVIGTVNMNMVMVDITDIPNVQVGDEVVIIGKQGDNTISVGAFGELSRILNYELLVSLPSEIPRIIVD